MKASQLRREFIEFFQDRQHEPVRSASLIPHDPTILFTVAGMVPFKSYFTGEEPAPYKRAVSIQKCVRAGGKHNDLSEVGHTAHHLTFFEMLGNFSFGDYFKPQAIEWGWEFSTEVLGFDPERIWVTVHDSDDEAAQLWLDLTAMPAERIQRMGEDNYWKMGDVGPCGPCSELYYDKGEQYGSAGGPAAGNEQRYVEFWNLVFMQFSQGEAGGDLTDLPNPSIDTGAGLERLLALLQGVSSVFEIDEMARLLDQAAHLTKTPLGQDPAKDVWLRILAEHARTMTMLITDDVLPSNEGRGYVLRRIMRRAIRHAHLLGADDSVCPDLADEVVAVMGDDYPDLAAKHTQVREIIAREEDSFRRTLAKGTEQLNEQLSALRPGEQLSGKRAFMFHDTYGFPVELVEEAANEQGFEVNMAEFEAEMAAQRDRARQDRQAKQGAASDQDLAAEAAVLAEHGETEFTGRFRPVEPVAATVLLVTDQGVILDRTPFYAEAGGQTGDTGTLVAVGGGGNDGNSEAATAAITDTTYILPGLHLHHTAERAPFEPGDQVTAAIDTTRREAIRRHHTGAHLLHWALREVLGEHVTQQGTFVGDDHFRFDFSHHQAVTPDELASIEDLINQNVLENEPVDHFEKPFDEAKQMGALSFFGDKYGDQVLVLQAGRHSLELCGGTHVAATGDIGLLKIISESSIGANIRRVECVCGTGVMGRLRQAEAKLHTAAAIVGASADDIDQIVQKQKDEIKTLRDELAAARAQDALAQADSLIEAAEDGLLVTEVTGIDREQLRDLALAVRQGSGIKAAVLGLAPPEGGVALAAAVDAAAGLNAADILAQPFKLVQGGGPKNPELVVGGGKNADQLTEALAAAKETALEQLGQG